jgi:uncharacterized repeat protein (TIGR02543 family)
MRANCRFFKLAWAALALALLLSACPKLTGEVDDEADKTTLYTAITLAGTAQAGVAVSVDGADVAVNAKWVTAVAKDVFAAALDSAQKVAGDASATQAQANKATSALTAAIKAFNGAKQGGTKAAGFTQSDFDTLKADATAAKVGVLASADGSGVPVTDIWVTETVMEAFSAAIAAANGVTAVNDTAYLDLSNALSVFNAAKRPGNGNGGKGASVIAITGIGSQYNGQYASFRSSGNTDPAGGIYLLGSTSSDRITGVQISGGLVNIPVYLVASASSTSAVPYTGNDKNITIYVIIKNSPSFTQDDVFDSRGQYTINAVNFTNGSASVNAGSSGGNENGDRDEKTLVITDIDTAQFMGISEWFIQIRLLPAGTASQGKLSSWQGITAGADSGFDDHIALSYSTPATATAKLYVPSTGIGINTDDRWTGSGVYDVYLGLFFIDGGTSTAELNSYYRKQNVSFASATTTVSAESFSLILMENGGSLNFTGTYTGTIAGAAATLTVSDSWALSAPGLILAGTYVLSGNTASLFYDRGTFGAAVLEGNTLTVTSDAPGYAGTYYFTKGESEQEPTQYHTVTFLDGFGNLIETQQVEHGKDATYPDIEVPNGYVHYGWDKPITQIRDDRTITAAWIALTQYIVVFLDGKDGQVIGTEQTVAKGSDATPPNAPTKEGYIFNGWEGNYTNVQQNENVYAKWKEIPQKTYYTVTFVSNGATLGTVSVESGYSAPWPAIPTHPETRYKFDGWEGDTNNVTEDRTVTAKWKAQWYYIEYLDGFGNSIVKKSVAVGGTDYSVPPAPVQEGYVFDGWDGDWTNMTEDRTLTAQWKKKL